MRSEYTTCSNCNLNSEIEMPYTYDILPNKGVQKSKTQLNFCNQCDVHTPWFMGEGTEEEIDDFDREINGIDKKTISLSKEVNDIINIINKNFINKIIYSSKRNSIEKKLNEFNKRKKSLSLKIKELKKKSKSFNYYKNKLIDPKCIFCGNEDFQEKPKHHCGGNLKIKRSKVSFSISLNNVNIKKIIYIHDEKGNAVKKYSQKFIEINKLEKYSKLTLKNKNKNLNLIAFKSSNKVIIYENIKDLDFIDPFVADLDLNTYVKTLNKSKKIDADTKKSIDEFLFKLEKEVEIKTIAEKAQEQLKRDLNF